MTDEEWARCWAAFGPWVTGDQEEARTIANKELNAPGLKLIRDSTSSISLSGIQCPTLVCVGELDPMTSVAAAEEIVHALPDGIARLEVIEHAGHFPWKDVPDQYWPVVIDFCQGGMRSAVMEA